MIFFTVDRENYFSLKNLLLSYVMENYCRVEYIVISKFSKNRLTVLFLEIDEREEPFFSKKLTSYIVMKNHCGGGLQ
jgi:hypothetical protein